ncbi:MAG TPA: hypothetical protein VF623_12790 [Segetibacter sp.]|jgi:hypothetical protein
MSTNDKEIRLDRKPDEERQSEFPLGDNTVKITPSPNASETAGFADNENLNQTHLGDVTGSPENDPATKSS